MAESYRVLAMSYRCPRSQCLGFAAYSSGHAYAQRRRRQFIVSITTSQNIALLKQFARVVLVVHERPYEINEQISNTDGDESDN